MTDARDFLGMEPVGHDRQWRLTVVPDAGHSALEPGVRRALVAAVERFRGLA